MLIISQPPTRCLLGFFLIILISCQPKNEARKYQAPVLTGLDVHSMDVSTDNADAQRFFNQGLMLAYGFNHAEAARSFREAVRLDPYCAMCYWGVALVLGPNINATMEDTDVEEAYFAVQKALEVSKNTTAWEKAMIEALAQRYSKVRVEDRASYDLAYADAMRKVYQQFPDHQDIAALFAESLMDVHPWDLWNKDGTPQPWTPEIVEVLETQLKKWPNHPSSNHLYIHAVEASKTPDRSNKSADLLADLVPGAGHLLHMPSHTYIRTGEYHKGSLVNLNAIKADSLYITACHALELYPLAYYPHNWHFLAATAALEGNGKTAIDASYQVSANANTDLMKEPGWGTLQHFYIIPYYMLVKFGQWDQILALPAPDEDMPYPTAILHYARGMAYLGKGDDQMAHQEWSLLKETAMDPRIEEITIWDINGSSSLVEIALLVLEAEVAAKKGNYSHAEEKLEQAISIEDQLNYNEPPDWFFSIRHHLGAILLEAKKFKAAEKVFLEDLDWLHENGWALKGLQKSLEGLGKAEAAEKVKTRFEKAWQWADIKLESSRISEIASTIYPFSGDKLMAVRSNPRFATGGKGITICGR